MGRLTVDKYDLDSTEFYIDEFIYIASYAFDLLSDSTNVSHFKAIQFT